MILNFVLGSLIIVPTIFIIWVLLISPFNFRIIKQVALLMTMVLLFIFSLLFFKINCFFLPFQVIHGFNFSFMLNFNYVIGIDVLNFLFIGLTLFLMPLCILVSWNSFYFRVKWFFLYLLIIEFFLINVFLSLDIIFFYLFFEALLIPLFLLITGWGSRERKIHASFMFFFYTLIGSLFMLLGIIFIYSHYGTTNLYVLNHVHISNYRQILLWLAFFLSFGSKIPMVPFHIWLPEAHVEAPTACSVLLAGILLKLGTYGFIRFSLLLFPYASVFFSPFIFTLSIMAIIYCSLATLRQIDIKKIIAYSSIVHMNFALLGLFSFNFQAVSGSIFLMISHGLVSSGLFLCIGFLYERYHSRLFFYYNGIIFFMPLFATTFFIFILGNMGFPGTCGFVGEFLIMIGLFQVNPLVMFLGGFSLIFCGIYSIWLFNRIVFSYMTKNSKIKYVADLNFRELAILYPLLFLVIFLGFAPSVILHFYDVFLYYFFTLFIK